MVEVTLQKANQTIKDLHIEHMSITTIDKARVLLDVDPTIYSWRVCFKREAGGLSVLDLGDSYTIIREHLPAYSAPWEEERIEMFITENGILGFLWVGASKEEEVLTENNTRLLGFDQIVERIGQQLKYFFTWTEDENIEASWQLTRWMAVLLIQQKGIENLRKTMLTRPLMDQ